MYIILNTAQYNLGVYNFYPTFLPTYYVKTIDLEFNSCKKNKKRSSCKGLGKQLKKAVSNHYYLKIKKLKSRSKNKTFTHENSKSF